jgi:hypothetical protein
VARRRQTARGFVSELVFIVLVVLAFMAFLSSGGPAALAQWMAGNMSFGPTPAATR